MNDISVSELRQIINGDVQNYFLNNDFETKTIIIKDILIIENPFQDNFFPSKNLILIFKECEFNIDFNVFNCSYNRIEFINCLFKKGFVLQETISVHNIIIEGGEFNKFSTIRPQINLEIIDGLFNEDLDLNGFWSINIRGGQFKGEIKVNPGGDFRGEINIKGGVFNKDLLFSNFQTSSCVIISGGEFKSSIRIENSTHFMGDFIIKQEVKTTINEVIISGGTFNKFMIEGGTIKSKFGVSGGTFLDDFSISGGTFLRDFIIDGGIFKKINFSFTKLWINLLKFENGFEFDDILLSGENSKNGLGLLCIEDFNLITGKISINDLGINSICFSRIINYSNINFINTFFRSISSLPKEYQENLEKRSTMADITNRFTIKSSDLGKITFIDCNFLPMEFDITSSKITEIFLAGSELPKKLIDNLPHHQKRLGYGQLKKVYENRGDFVTAHEYYSKEMNALFDSYKWSFFWEKINLLLNNISSNHGLSWQRALLGVLTISFIFYNIYGLLINLSFTNFGDYLRFLSYILEFINPLHKSDFIVDDLNKNGLSVNISCWARLWDGFSRIIITYFIYQFVQAFRKHGRRV